MTKQSKIHDVEIIPNHETKGHIFIQAYDKGIDFITKCAQERDNATIILYLRMIKDMDKETGALMIDASTLMSQTGLSKSAVYRSIKTLKESGMIRSRYSKVYEINPDGFWKGKRELRDTALFFAESNRARNVKYRLNPASASTDSFTVPATFEEET
ncbi:helix-turn-helix domain-containing protein [Photorhabdus sp. SF281]|uniref:helix-turn-helix domain-containing protein n=1 Tax=Photorhabdus sp. SF281 TaxID=3459527 RepID=UPI004043A223